MRVTVVGAAGNLGRHLCEELSAQGHGVDAVGRERCDLTRPDAALLARMTSHLRLKQIDVVVNAAAYTDVDGAEAEADVAFTINALGAEMIARAAAAAGAATCHISTDFVFDGESARPYDEFDRPRPISVYARSKLAGEELVQRATARSFVVRVQGLYGRGGRNFVSTLARRLKSGQRLVIDRQRRVTPTWSRALARQLIALIGTEEFGLYHATCLGETTWHGFASAMCAMAEELGANLARSWEPVDTAALASPAPRPASSVLDNRMLRLRGLSCMPTWEEALREYLCELHERGEL